MRLKYNAAATGEFSRSKLFPFFIPAAIEVGKPYYFNNAPEIDLETVTGVDAFCYDVLNPNFPATLPIGQINYNTIFVGDVYRVLVVFNDKDGNLILKAPLSSFSRFVTVNNTPTLKPRNYLMKIASGKSYFQFVEPILTPNPVVIPLNFFFK